MRASTLFALTIAILVGLGVAVAAKVSGLFNPPPPAPPAPVAKKADIQILVAAKNLFAGGTIDSGGVKVRNLKPDEAEHYQRNKEEYLPPLVNAAMLRITKKDIPADQPILQSDLERLEKPESLNARLMPTMRAVSLSVEKDNSAGGLIAVGDWVDLLLTTNITNSQGKTVSRTAAIAPRVRVVAKRNTLWPIFAPLPEGKPVQFTVEMNPYRAALFEYAKSKGTITMTPLPSHEQKSLEQERAALMNNPDQIKQVHFVKPGTLEAEREDEQVAKYNHGQLVVGEWDLIHLFNLTTGAPPEPATSIEQLAGLNHYKPAVFSTNGQRVLPAGPGSSHDPRPEASAAIGGTSYEFSEVPPPSKVCKTCKKKKS